MFYFDLMKKPQKVFRQINFFNHKNHVHLQNHPDGIRRRNLRILGDLFHDRIHQNHHGQNLNLIKKLN